MWPGYADSTSLEIGWWSPLTGTVDHYRVYMDGNLLYGTLVPWTSSAPTGVVADGNMGQPGHPLPWYTAIGLSPGTTHQFVVTSVDPLGNESGGGAALTMTTLSNGSSAQPTPVSVSPESWIQALPTSYPPTAGGTVWVVTQTTAANYNLAGTGTNNATGCGLGYALTHSNINGGDAIITPSATPITLPNAGAVIPAYTGTNGWTVITTDQDPIYASGGFLTPYSVVKSNFGLTPLTFTAAPAAAATSAVLAPNQPGLTDSTGKWLLRGGYYYISFPDGEERLCNFARQSTTVSWTAFNSTLYANGAGLTNTQTSATCLLAGPDGVTGVHNYVTPSDPTFAMSTLNFGAANGPCITLQPGTAKVRFIGLAMIPTRGLPSNNTVFEAVVWSPQQSPTSFPTPTDHIYFDRCYWGDDLTVSGSSAILHAIGFVNSTHFLVQQCYFTGTMTNSVNSGSDSNAILVAGGQFHCIRNNYLSAGSESYLYGGVFVGQNTIPQDISIQYNMTHKPVGWAPGQAVPAFRTQYTENVKNLGEFKVGVRVEISGNLALNCWTDQAAGYHGAAFALGCRDQTIPNSAHQDNQTNPWNTVTDVWFHDNQVYNCQTGFISFTADGTTGLDARVKITNNLCWLSTLTIVGEPLMGVRLLGPCVDHIIDHNTFIPNTVVGSQIGAFGVRTLDFGAFGTVSGGYGNPQPFTPNGWHNFQDRITITNNIIGGMSTAGTAIFQESGVPNLFTAYPNATISKNITITDPATYNASGVLASSLALSAVGFTVTPTGTSIPLHPTDWNVSIGPYVGIGCSFGSTPPPAAVKVNWAPGHYLQFGENDTAASRIATINALPSNSGIVGVVDVWIWAHLEGALQGSYTFTDPNSVLSACQAKGLKYILDVASRAFGSASFTGIIPQYVINNGWTYTRPAGPAAGGASVWVNACMLAKTNLELAFANQAASFTSGPNPTMVAFSSDESVIGASLTTTQPYSASALVTAEITQRWTLLRSAFPQLAVILYTNFMTSDTGGSTNMLQLFTTAASMGGILINGGPDCFAQNVPGSSETAGQQCCDGQIGGVNYCGALYGVLGGVQNAENGATTFQQVFDAFNNHFQAQYQQWYEAPTWGTGGGAALKTFLANNPVTNTAYPQNWPGATQPSFSQVFNFPNFSGSPSTIHLNSSGGSGGFTGTAINLCAGTHQNGSAWYTTPVNITKFRTDFTMQFPAGQIIPACKSISFVIQNSDAGTNPSSMPGNGVGLTAIGDANLGGYGAYWWTTGFNFQLGIGNSVAVVFDMSNSNGTSNSAGNGNQGTTTYNPLAGPGPNSIGLYTQTGPSSSMLPKCDLNPTGVNLYNGNVLACSIIFDGTNLTVLLKDTVTNAQARVSWQVPVATIVGGSTALVGFTAGQAGTNASGQNLINSWSFNTGSATSGSLPVFNQPVLSVGPGQYTASQTVSITNPGGGVVFYTTNGQAPTNSSTAYSGPITINSSTFLQAVASQNGFTDSGVSSAYYQISASKVPNINLPNFTGANNLFSLCGTASITGSSLFLTQHIQLAQSPQVGYVAAAWFVAPQSVGTFTSQFVFQMQAGIGGQAQACGLCFVIQNQPLGSAFKFNDAIPTSTDNVLRYSAGGPLAMATGAGFGYSGNTGTSQAEPVGLTRSVAVKFDATPGGAPCFTGLYTNGAQVVGNVGSNLSATGLDFTTGHQFQVNMTYDGTNLSWTIKDLTTSTSFSSGNQAVNIPSLVGSVAYVGFTAGTNVGNSQQINSWTFTS